MPKTTREFSNPRATPPTLSLLTDRRYKVLLRSFFGKRQYVNVSIKMIKKRNIGTPPKEFFYIYFSRICFTDVSWPYGILNDPRKPTFPY
jgi:hypothetical protein